MSILNDKDWDNVTDEDDRKVFLVVGDNISNTISIAGFSSKELAENYANHIESATIRELQLNVLDITTDLSWFYIKIKRAKLRVYSEIEILPYKSPDIITQEHLQTSVRWVKSSRSFIATIWATNAMSALSEVMAIVEKNDSEKFDDRNTKDESLGG